MPLDLEKRRERVRRNYRENKNGMRDKAKIYRSRLVVGERRNYAKRWHARRRQLFDILKEHPCQDCGQMYPPYVMDWDHRDPKDKVMTIADMKNCTAWDKVLAEIAKCDLVCSNCHRIRTHRRREARH